MIWLFCLLQLRLAVDIDPFCDVEATCMFITCFKLHDEILMFIYSLFQLIISDPLTSDFELVQFQVLISGKEEPEAALSPAMDAIIRIFKRVNGLPENDGDKATVTAFCSIRLLVASTQAISLIGKQGSLIKSIQETTGASVRVLSNGTITYSI